MNFPSGDRLPGVLRPWALSIRIFIVLSVRQLWDSWAKVEKIYYICRKFAKANLLIALSLVPIVRHRVLLFYQIRHILGTYLKENPSQNALRGVFCGVTGTTFEERFAEHYRLTL